MKDPETGSVPRQPDHGKLVGMSLICGRADLETAAEVVHDLGFEAMEVHASQLSPGLPGVPVFEGHAAAAGELIRRHGLQVSTLNVVGDATFDPFSGPEGRRATIEGLATHLRWAAAMGAPRVLIWEGRVAEASDVPDACRALAEVIDEARIRSGLQDPPRVSCELHPFTFALRHRALAQLGSALRSVEAGVCFDLCHFGVALGASLLDHIDDEVLTAIDHIHYSDTDGVTSELHFPPGDGILDLEAIGARVAGLPIAASWDLFGWPEPRHAVRSRMGAYRAFVEALATSVHAVAGDTARVAGQGSGTAR
jgi:sugar phosphate isomerase/epimerase